MLFRLPGLNALALALPPLSPPSLPKATAAGFFSRGSPVASWTMLMARELGSDGFLERLGMPRSLGHDPRPVK